MTCLSELFTAAAVFLFAIGMMINGGEESETFRGETALAASLVMGATGATYHPEVTQSQPRQSAEGAGSGEYRHGSFQSLPAAGSPWVVLREWQDYQKDRKSLNANLAILPVATVEGYRLVAATYSFTHAGEAAVSTEPIRYRF